MKATFVIVILQVKETKRLPLISHYLYTLFQAMRPQETLLHDYVDLLLIYYLC